MSRYLYHILAFLVAAIWGVTFVNTKVLIAEGLAPGQIFALRFSLAYAGIWILCLLRKDRRLTARSIRDELVFAFLGFSGGAMYFLTENTALAYTQAGNVSFLVCSAPLLTALLTMGYKRLFRDRFADAMETVRFRGPFIVGTLLAFAGMALVLFDGARFSFSLRGDLLAVGAALCWGMYSLFMGKMTADYGAVFATRKVFFYGLLTIIPFLFLGFGGDFATGLPELPVLQRPKVYLNLVFLGLVASLLCFMAWNKVMSEIGNVTSTNYVYLNPFFTLVNAALFLGERMTPGAICGSLFIVAGVFVATSPQLRKA